MNKSLLDLLTIVYNTLKKEYLGSDSNPVTKECFDNDGHLTIKLKQSGNNNPTTYRDAKYYFLPTSESQTRIRCDAKLVQFVELLQIKGTGSTDLVNTSITLEFRYQYETIEKNTWTKESIHTLQESVLERNYLLSDFVQ